MQWMAGTLLLGPTAKDRELVLCSNADGRTVHQELFKLDDSHYLLPAASKGLFGLLSDIITRCRSVSSRPGYLHLVLDWPDLLKISLWVTEIPTQPDVLALLQKAGLADSELKHLRCDDVSGIFSGLRHNDRLDVLRKLCHIASSTVESLIGDPSVGVVCHIFAGEPNRILASSL